MISEVLWGKRIWVKISEKDKYSRLFTTFQDYDDDNDDDDDDDDEMRMMESN